MTPPPMIEAVGLTKAFSGRPVLDGVDLTAEAGTVLALLGPNGAGKTTTVRILATLTAPDSGSARVAGYDVSTARTEVRRRISLTGQFAAVDEFLTGRENLVMMGRLRHLSRRAARTRTEQLLATFELGEAADRRVSTYSGGMRRRLDIAAGLLTDPEVLFLDEPTTGLDPRGRQAMWDVVVRLASTGVTVLLTTQYLEEADRLADRIAVIDSGRIVAQGTADELKRRVAGQRLDLVLPDDVEYCAVLAELGARVIHTDRAARTIGLPSEGSAASVRAELDRLDPQATRVVRFALHRASLDDVFLAITGSSTITPTHERETCDV